MECEEIVKGVCGSGDAGCRGLETLMGAEGRGVVLQQGVSNLWITCG